MSKLSVVRQIKQQKNSNGELNKEMNKELKWDGRFHLGKLPNYNAMKDVNYLSMKMLREQIKSMEVATKKKISPSKERIDVCSNYYTHFPYLNNKFLTNNNDALSEEVNILQSMWDDLGVTDEYRQVFENIALEFSEKLRKDFFEFEINSLKKTSENLFKLSKDISSRDKAISKLGKIDGTLSNTKEKPSDKLINEISQLIRNIRIQSMNIVYHFNKIREISSYNIMSGKINLEKLNKIYSYDRNYLIKMRYDLEFLSTSSLSEYFEFPEQSDPFMISASENLLNPHKHFVPISAELLPSIRECEFHMINDVIFHQMENNKLNNKNRNSNSINKSPKQFKLNYPLANPVAVNKQKSSAIPSGSTSRPFSSSIDFYKMIEKSSENYKNIILNKKNETCIKGFKDKRIVIDNKIKLDREDYKSQENFYNNKERAKSTSRKVKIDNSSNKNDNDYLYKYTSNMMDQIERKEVILSEKLESNNNYIAIESKESVITKENNFYPSDKIISEENILKDSALNSKENIIVEKINLNSDTIKNLEKLGKSKKNISYSDSRDESYTSIKRKVENVEEDFIKEEFEKKIDKEMFNDKKFRLNENSLQFDNHRNNDKILNESVEEEAQYEVEKLIKKESFVEKSIEDRSLSKKSNEIQENKDNLISRISGQNSEDHKDLEDEVNYDLFIEEQEANEEEVKENINNILVDLKCEEKENDFGIDAGKLDAERKIILENDVKENKKTIESVIHSKPAVKPINIDAPLKIDVVVLDKILNKKEDIQREDVRPLNIAIAECHQEENKSNSIKIKDNTIKKSLSIDLEDRNKNKEILLNLNENKKISGKTLNSGVVSHSNNEHDKNLLNKNQDKDLSEKVMKEKDGITSNKVERGITSKINLLEDDVNEQISKDKKEQLKSISLLDNKQNDKVSTGNLYIDELKINPSIINKQPIANNLINVISQNESDKIQMPFDRFNIQEKETNVLNLIKHENIQVTNNELDIVKHEINSNTPFSIQNIQKNNIELDENIEEINTVTTENNMHANSKINSIPNDKIHENLHDDKIQTQIAKTESPFEEITPASPISVSFFSGELDNFQYIYPIYLTKVSEELKVSFKIENDLRSYLTGTYPKILLAYKDNMMRGICCVSYDSGNEFNLRLNINHISTNSYDDFELIANEFKNFIVNNIPCDEIRIGIYYEMKNGNLDINNYIRDVFRKSMKFKWFKLENKSNNERIQILNLKCENKNLLLERNKLNNYLSLNYLSVLKLGEFKDKENLNANRNWEYNEQKINFFSILFSLIELTKQNYELENENFQKISLGNLDKYANNILNSSGSREEIQEFIQKNTEMFFDINLAPILDTNLASNFIKSNLKFSNYLTSALEINDQKYLFNRIETTSIEVLIENETQQEFYLIPSIDGINSMIICEIDSNSELEQIFDNSKKNLSQIFSELYFKLEKSSSKKVINNIWLPCFKFDDGLSFTNPQSMSEIIVKKDGTDFCISHVEEVLQFGLNNDYDWMNCPDVNPNDEDLVIKKKFIIALVNYELLNEINIPSVFVYAVSPSNWVKI